MTDRTWLVKPWRWPAPTTEPADPSPHRAKERADVVDQQPRLFHRREVAAPRRDPPRPACLCCGSMMRRINGWLLKPTSPAAPPRAHSSRRAVIGLPVELRRRATGIGEPVERDLASSWSRSTASSGSGLFGLVHSANFSAIQASCPTGNRRAHRPASAAWSPAGGNSRRRPGGRLDRRRAPPSRPRSDPAAAAGRRRHRSAFRDRCRHARHRSGPGNSRPNGRRSPSRCRCHARRTWRSRAAP